MENHYPRNGPCRNHFLISISKLKGTRKIYVSAAASALIACISIAALIVFNLMLPGMEIASFIMLAAIASTAWRYLFADNSQKKLSQAFGWRLGREAIERLSKKPELVSTSTRAREGSALVLDIKAFGKISELGSEDDFRNFLIDYRTITTGIITRRGGFIESWSADECTAIFGAPVPLKNDALQAALSAVEIKKAAESHTEAWRHKFGIEKVRVGIGISRGKIISSDFGLGFGFAGSAIEGAKQLNRLNRLYKTWGLHPAPSSPKPKRNSNTGRSTRSRYGVYKTRRSYLKSWVNQGRYSHLSVVMRKRATPICKETSQRPPSCSAGYLNSIQMTARPNSFAGDQ